MFIAIDFDGVLHDYKHPVPGRRMGRPVAGSIEALEALRGHELVIFTVKPPKVVQDWLAYWKFPPLRVTNTKEDFDLIVDDKAIRFTNWNALLAQLAEVTV